MIHHDFNIRTRFKVASQFFLVCCLTAAFSNSHIGTLGLGLEQSPYSVREIGMGHSGMASVQKKGLSLINPSKTAYNQRTTFEGVFMSGLEYLQDSQTSNTLGFSNVPMVGGDFPLGRWGNFGLAYYQRFLREYEHAGEVTDPIRFEGGAFNFVFNYAYQLAPYLSVGATYQMLSGRSRMITESTFDLSEVEDLLGDTTLTKYTGKSTGLSMTYRHRLFNVAISSSLPMGEIEQETKRNIQGQRSAPAVSNSFDPPMNMALGLCVKAFKKQLINLDFGTAIWDDDLASGEISQPFSVSMGYELQGSFNPYDPYYKKIALRAGMGWQQYYLLEAQDLKATIGAGFPLGRRKSQVDVAVELGRRGNLDELGFREDYLKVYISFMGAGQWGRSMRPR